MEMRHFSVGVTPLKWMLSSSTNRGRTAADKHVDLGSSLSDKEAVDRLRSALSEENEEDVHEEGNASED